MRRDEEVHAAARIPIHVEPLDARALRIRRDLVPLDKIQLYNLYFLLYSCTVTYRIIQLFVDVGPSGRE